MELRFEERRSITATLKKMICEHTALLDREKDRQAPVADQVLRLWQVQHRYKTTSGQDVVSTTVASGKQTTFNIFA